MTTINWSSFLETAASIGVDVERNRPMAHNTTYAVGGHAACAITVRSRRDLQEVADLLAAHPDIPVAVVGRGSNLLVADNGFDGVVVLMSYVAQDNDIELVGDDIVAPGAIPMPILARRSVGLERTGLEWCVGIPGSVGGAVRMNAGGHGAEMLDSLVSAEVVSLKSGRWATIDAVDLGFHFRGSALAGHHVVVSARMNTSTRTETSPQLDEVVMWRRQNQPGGRNAGSVFVNPAQGEGSAGALIDACGLREYAVGGARVSEKHANFIQASDGATASHIVAVMQHVQSTVETQYGIRLRSEVCLLGFDAEITQAFSDPRHNKPERIAHAKKLSELMGETS
jgi:UDP-N-acetylmuramate dehydrogenase